MKNLLFTALVTILSVSFALAQPTVQWQKTLGGTGNDGANSIQQTNDGGYIVAGGSSSNDGDVSGNHGGEYDCWIFKISSLGTIMWQKSLGGSGSDGASSIQKTTDGGYIVLGQSDSNDGDVSGNHGGSDYWVVKLDSLGTIEWQKSFGGSSYDYASSIQQTIDGGFVVSGSSNSNNGNVSGSHEISGSALYDFWVVKLNSVGSIEWQRPLGGSGDDHAGSIQQTIDGGYIVVGNSDSNDGDVSGNHGGSDYWVVKLTSNGAIQWQKTLGGTDYDASFSIQLTNEGGFIIAGFSLSNDGDVSSNRGGGDYWVVKLTNIGIIEWQKSLGGSSDELASSITQTNDGGYIVVGYSSSNDGDVSGNHGYTDYWVVKLTNNGAIEWQKSIGGSGSEEAITIQQTNEGEYIVAGRTDSNDGDISGYHGGLSDCYIVKLNSSELSIENIEPDLFSVFPNPAQNTINIKAENKLIGMPYDIYDNIGKVVLQGKINKNNTVIEIGNLSGGIYLFNVGENLQQTFKIIPVQDVLN